MSRCRPRNWPRSTRPERALDQLIEERCGGRARLVRHSDRNGSFRHALVQRDGAESVGSLCREACRRDGDAQGVAD